MICLVHPTVTWNGIGPCGLCVQAQYHNLASVVVGIKASWEAQIKKNEETAKALAAKGLYEQAASCQKDNGLIRSFIADLDGAITLKIGQTEQHEPCPVTR